MDGQRCATGSALHSHGGDVMPASADNRNQRILALLGERRAQALLELKLRVARGEIESDTRLPDAIDDLIDEVLRARAKEAHKSKP